MPLPLRGPECLCSVGNRDAEPILIVIGVQLGALHDLPHVSRTRNSRSLFPRGVQGGQKKARKDRDHGNYDQEFQKGETMFFA